MALYELHMHQMGESILEATILKWMIEVGQEVRQDDIILEVATDKVDSEIPSPVTGKVLELKAKEGDEIPIGQVIATLETDDSYARSEQDLQLTTDEPSHSHGSADASGFDQRPTVSEKMSEKETPREEITVPAEVRGQGPEKMIDDQGRFFSPLVRTIAQTENVSAEELRRIVGTGL